MHLNNLIEISKNLIDKPDSKHKHFSFIIRKNRIMSIGWNNRLKTHPLCHRHNYPYPFVHSEVAAIVKFPEKISELCKCTLVNIRLSKKLEPVLSHPCKNCRKLLASFNFRKVLFTNNFGKFEEL